MQDYLKATKVIDSDNPEVQRTSHRLTEEIQSSNEKAKVLFYFVRDSIKYHPLFFNYYPESAFKASETLKQGYGFCMTKAVLLAALLKATNIPSRLLFARIKNYLLPKRILDFIGTDVILHGYLEAYLQSKWVALNPAFDLDFCELNGFVVTDFDGYHNAPFSPFDKRGRKHIEYVQVYEPFTDFPHDFVIKYLREAHGHLDAQRLRELNGGYYEGWF